MSPVLGILAERYEVRSLDCNLCPRVSSLVGGESARAPIASSSPKAEAWRDLRVRDSDMGGDSKPNFEGTDAAIGNSLA